MTTREELEEMPIGKLFEIIEKQEKEIKDLNDKLDRVKQTLELIAMPIKFPK